MSKIVGYARVSTREQNLERQLAALRKYVPEDMIVTDKASGKDLNRDGYMSLKVGIGKLVKGDTLYIKSLDRLSRNKEEAKRELQYFKDNGIRLKVIDLPTTLVDYPEDQHWVLDMVTNILIEVYTSIAENERDTIRKRQREGIEAMPIDDATGKRKSAKTGKTIGRPKATFPQNWSEVYKMWRAGKITARKAMEILQLKPNTFYKLVKETDSHEKMQNLVRVFSEIEHERESGIEEGALNEMKMQLDASIEET